MAYYNSTLAEYRDAIERIYRYIVVKGKKPSTVTVGGKKFTAEEYDDAVKRVQNYTVSKKAMPKTIRFGTQSVVVTPPKPIDNWVTTGLFKQDYQDTGYTCGPSSAQMVFSAFGITLGESQIAKLAGTTTAGTSHSQLYSAMKKLVPSLVIEEFYLSDIGFDGIITKLKGNREVILHIQTAPLSKDANGNAVWTHNYGHYIFLVGINPVTRRVRVADPTKGVKEFTYQQMTNAINAVSGQKSVMVFYKP